MFKNLLRRTSLAVLAVTIVTMTACGSGGGGSEDSSGGDMPKITDVPTISKVDTFEGTGETATIGETLTIQYEGWLFDSDADDFKGTMFDSVTEEDDYTFTSGNGEVIPGLDQGVQGMKEGGKRTIIIPSRLAYGRRGLGPVPPNTAVVFDVELLNVE